MQNMKQTALITWKYIKYSELGISLENVFSAQAWETGFGGALETNIALIL